MTRIYYKHLYLSLLFALLSACGGGGGNDPEPTNNTPDAVLPPSDTTPSDTTPSDTTAPTASLTPTNLARNIDSTANIIATFDEDMFASTINSDNFTLSDFDGDIEATVSFDALTNIATLNPNASLGFLKGYTARLKMGITDLSGNALARTITTFTTGDGSWNGPAFLLDGASGGSSSSPEMVVSANGDAIVVFEKLDNAISNIYTHRYSVNDGWSIPVRLDTGNDFSSFPQVAIDANGNAVVVWLQGPGNVYASRYTTASGWGTAELIENNIQSAVGAPSIAMDPAGNAIVVWSQFVNATDIAVKLNSYNAATENWLTAINVGAPEALIQKRNPKVTFGLDGTRIISWTENGAKLVATVSRANTAPLFGQQINTNIGGDTPNHQTIVDSNGNVMIVWQQTDASLYNTYARYLSAGSASWGAAILLETTNNTTFSSAPSLAVDPAGNVIAVWVQYDGIRTDLWANRFSNFNKVWGTAELIEEAAGWVTRTTGGAVEIAAAGVNAFSAIWSQENAGGGTDVWTNRFTPNGWGTAEMIESSPGSTKRAVVDFDSNGNGIAVWIQRNTGRDAVLTRHFN